MMNRNHNIDEHAEVKVTAPDHSANGASSSRAFCQVSPAGRSSSERLIDACVGQRPHRVARAIAELGLELRIAQRLSRRSNGIGGFDRNRAPVGSAYGDASDRLGRPSRATPVIRSDNASTEASPNRPLRVSHFAVNQGGGDQEGLGKLRLPHLSRAALGMSSRRPAGDRQSAASPWNGQEITLSSLAIAAIDIGLANDSHFSRTRPARRVAEIRASPRTPYGVSREFPVTQNYFPVQPKQFPVRCLREFTRNPLRIAWISYPSEGRKRVEIEKFPVIFPVRRELRQRGVPAATWSRPRRNATPPLGSLM